MAETIIGNCTMTIPLKFDLEVMHAMQERIDRARDKPC
jgi:hypothetical protein